MGFLRSHRKLLATPFVIIGVLLLLWLAGQIEQRILRRQAERLLSQFQSVELRKTTWQEAQLLFEPWGARRRFSGSCDASSTCLEITLEDPVNHFIWNSNFFVKLDDYFRWKLNLHYATGPFVRFGMVLFDDYLRLGGHPARITAKFGMRDGIVWEKSFYLLIDTYGHPAYWTGDFRLGFPLTASIYSVPRFQYLDQQQIDSELYLHPDYVIGRPGGCTICVFGWVRFSPYADPADLRRITQLDLSCLTRWRPCVSQIEVMPGAWDQYLADHSRLDNDQTVSDCSPSMLMVMGRDSTQIVTVSVIDSRPGTSGTIVRARVVELVKGSTLRIGEALEWSTLEYPRISDSVSYGPWPAKPDENHSSKIVTARRGEVDHSVEKSKLRLCLIRSVRD
jgi:hypothetical protein